MLKRIAEMFNALELLCCCYEHSEFRYDFSSITSTHLRHTTSFLDVLVVVFMFLFLLNRIFSQFLFLGAI